jgi:hypothetical protein
LPAALVTLITVFIYVLHQDFWLWHRARPLVFGVLPAGLAYHAGYTLAVSLLMWGLVKYRWPSHLEDASERAAEAGAATRRGKE